MEKILSNIKEWLSSKRKDIEEMKDEILGLIIMIPIIYIMYHIVGYVKFGALRLLDFIVYGH